VITFWKRPGCVRTVDNNDDITTITTPSFQGEAEADMIVLLHAGFTIVGQAVANTDASDGILGNGLGTYLVTATAMAPGDYDFSVQVEDLAGNIGAFSPLLHVKIIPSAGGGGGGGGGGGAGIGVNAFNTATDYLAGNRPHGVAIGDVNGDTFPDMVVANSKGNTVSVRLGSATGIFGTEATFSTGGKKPVSVALGLMDGDANLDAVVANSGTNNVAILLGNGDGTFQAPTTFGTGKTPMSVRIGFIDGDGALDVATANSAATP
jgi:hypothetical protein